MKKKLPKYLPKWLIFSNFIVYKVLKTTKPLEQVYSLVLNALRSVESREKAFVSFFTETMSLYLTANSRINFMQMQRLGKSCESRFRQNFRKPFDWLRFNLFFAKSIIDSGHLTAIAIDPSYISKSGKHTPGVGYFWSGCASAAKHGLEILGIALIDSETRKAVFLRAVQTLKDKIYKGRKPACIAHLKNEDTLIGCYLRALYRYREQLLALSNLVVADAFFSKATFVDGLMAMGFHLVSRFQKNVRLRYLSNAPRTGKRGRPKEYDGAVDINHPDQHFTKETLTWDDKQILVYTAIVYAVALKRNVKVVIVDCLDEKKKTQERKVFFSTDLSLTAKQIIDIYRTRFQIEFLFRDAKQHFGLYHCQARSTAALDFHFNASFAALNIVRTFAEQFHYNFSVADCKLLLHNSMLIQRFFVTFGKTPNLTKNKGDNNTIFKELLLYGIKAAA